MKRTYWFGVAALTAAFSAGTLFAATVAELEADGTAVNNSVATAQAVASGAFTVDPNPNIFTAAEGGLPGTAVTASIVGHTGGDGSLDIDFYSFTLPVAGPVWLDIDSDREVFDPDSTLQLFDASGTLIAQNDDSFFDLNGDSITEPDPGSVDEGGASFDSFIGAITLPAGTYYAAVAEFSNFASGGGTGTSTFMDSNFYPAGFTWWSTFTGTRLATTRSPLARDRNHHRRATCCTSALRPSRNRQPLHSGSSRHWPYSPRGGGRMALLVSSTPGLWVRSRMALAASGNQYGGQRCRAPSSHRVQKRWWKPPASLV